MSTSKSNVELLGPGPAVDHGIDAFGSGYQTAKETFDILLQYPYLEAIKYTNDKDQTSEKGKTGDNKPDEKKKNLRELLLEGQSCFRISTERDRKAAIDLVSYGQIAGSMLKNRRLSNFVQIIGPIAERMAGTASDNAAMKSGDYKELKSFIDTLNRTIVLTTTNLATVTAKLSNVTTDLSNINVRETLTKLLGGLFEFATSDEDINTQLGILLGLAAEAVSRALKKLTTDKPALLALVASLKKLSTQLGEIGGHLRQLSSALPDIIQADQAISGVFSTVQRNLALLADRDVDLTPEELTAVVAMWEQNGKHIKQMLGIMDGVAAAQPMPVADTPLRAAYPIEPAALSMYQLANTGVGNKNLFAPEHLQVASRMAADEKVVNYLSSKAFDGFRPNVLLMMPSSDSNQSTTMPKISAQKLAEMFSPPQEMVASLKNLQLKCTTIKQKFDGLLQVPGMEFLQVDNPFILEDQQGLLKAKIPDSTPSKVAKLNLREMIIRYKDLYGKIEDDSVTLIRQLSTYAATQIALLPLLTITEQIGKTTFQKYVTAHKAQIEDLKRATVAMEHRHLDFKRKWHDAEISILKLINEERENMATFEAKIISLEKEQSDANYPLFGALKIVGGLAMIAVSVFLAPTIFLKDVGVGIGVSLLEWGISDLVKNGKLSEAISQVRALLGKVKERLGVLAPVLVVMQEMSTAISSLLDIFSMISLNLNTIAALVDTADLLVSVRELVIDKWNGILISAKEYLTAVNAP